MPDLPPDVILDAYGIGNIADIVKKIKEKQEEDKQMALETEKAQMTQQQQIQNPQNGGQEAFAAARSIIQGQAPQVPANAGPQYLQAFDQIIANSQEAGDLDPEILQALQTFRDQVAQGIGRQQ
jgi:sensor domain CHASE-containing protein